MVQAHKQQVKELVEKEGKQLTNDISKVKTTFSRVYADKIKHLQDK